MMTYGTTPPRAGAAAETLTTAAVKLADRVRSLPLDALLVYDVQDEGDRTGEPRPFPFVPASDPRPYAQQLRALTGFRAIVFKAIATMEDDAWAPWLTETRRDYDLDHLVLVGRSSSRLATGLTLEAVMRLAAAHEPAFTLGGVTIAERHGAAHSESERLLQKARNGCRFFVSQAVYDPAATIRLLTSYARDCARTGVAPGRVLMTLVPCGREKTLAFLRWLGVTIPSMTARAILTDPAPLSRSIALCRDNLRAILDQPYVETLPLGLNVESVSIYRNEIDASIDLFFTLRDVLREFRLTP